MAGGWQQPMPTLEQDYGMDEMSEWLDIGPTVEEESGWGVDENNFTTTLDYSQFSEDQIRQAQMVARQITRDQKQFGESRHFDKNMRDRRMQVKHDTAAPGVHSAEEAIEMLRRQKERQAAPGHVAPTMAHHHVHVPPPAPVHEGYNELGAVQWLMAELRKCADNIAKFGDPPPQHAARFLLRFGAELLQWLPMPPPDVKVQVLSSFSQVGWDVRIRKPHQGSRPPNGQQLTSLAFGLCCFFAHRTGQPLPPESAGIVNLPVRPPAPAPQAHAPPIRVPAPRKQQHSGKGGGKGSGLPVPRPRDGSGGHYAGGGGQQNRRIQQPDSRGKSQQRPQSGKGNGGGGKSGGGKGGGGKGGGGGRKRGGGGH